MPDQSSAATEHAILQQITAPLHNLPDDPLAVVDADFPTAVRGYDRHAVDHYVDKTRQLVAELQAIRSPEAAVRRALEQVGTQVAGVLQRAHETAEEITTRSRAEAEDRLELARREAAEIIAAAEQRGRELDADADRIWGERQRIIADVEDLSGQLLEVARDAADRFAQPESTLIVTGIEDDRGEVPSPAADRPAAPDEDEPVDAVEVVDDESELESDRPDALRVIDSSDQAEGDAPAHDTAEFASAGEADPGVDETVAFRPLDRYASDPGDAAGDHTEPPPRPRRVTDDDVTHVIPPSSEAAHRRRQS